MCKRILLVETVFIYLSMHRQPSCDKISPTSSALKQSVSYDRGDPNLTSNPSYLYVPRYLGIDLIK